MGAGAHGSDLPDRYAPPRIDVTAPSVARAYDFLLGGKNNYRADQTIVNSALRAAPDLARIARDNRAFVVRAVRHLAAAGIRQFLDIGSGLPADLNIHEIVAEAAPDAVVVYVDKDPVVISHGRALLAENERTAVVQADLVQPQGILAHPRVRALVDLDAPVGLILSWVLNFIPDDNVALWSVAHLTGELAPGSHVVLSHLTSDAGGADLAHAKRAAGVIGAHYGPLRVRPSSNLPVFLDGLEILDPGVVPVTEWPEHQPDAQPGWCFGAVGRKV